MPVRSDRSLPGLTVAIDSIADVDRLLPHLAAKSAPIINTFNRFDIKLYRHLVDVAKETSVRIVHDPGGALFHDIAMNNAIGLGVRSIGMPRRPGRWS